MLARLFHALASFRPTMVGTYPLGLQVPGSDFDIACQCDDLDTFEDALRGALAELGIVATIWRSSAPAVVASATIDVGEVEVFGQVLPVTDQAAFRHMIVEGRLLAIGGEALRARIVEAKLDGQRTEHAFATLLGLSGDPYDALLALENASQSELRALVGKALAPVAQITRFAGERAILLPLFRLADDSEQEIAGYHTQGEVLVAVVANRFVGHAQLVEGDARTWELKSLAVAQGVRRHGLGRQLVEAAFAFVRARGGARVVLATGAADSRLLRFYQQCGFRLERIERDAFTQEAGYAPDITVDGIPLRDRVWLDRAL